MKEKEIKTVCHDFSPITNRKKMKVTPAIDKNYVSQKWKPVVEKIV